MGTIVEINFPKTQDFGDEIKAWLEGGPAVKKQMEKRIQRRIDSACDANFLLMMIGTVHGGGSGIPLLKRLAESFKAALAHRINHHDDTIGKQPKNFAFSGLVEIGFWMTVGNVYQQNMQKREP